MPNIRSNKARIASLKHTAYLAIKRPAVTVSFRLLCLLVLFIFIRIVCFSAPISPAYAEKEPNEVIAGVHNNFPPQYSIDEQTGKPTGFAIDIMDEVARRAGLQVRYVIFDKWPPIYEALEEERIGWTSELEKSTGPKKMPLFS